MRAIKYYRGWSEGWCRIVQWKTICLFGTADCVRATPLHKLQWPVGREGCESGNLLYKNKCRERAEAIIQIWADTTLPLVKPLDKKPWLFFFFTKVLKNVFFFSLFSLWIAEKIYFFAPAMKIKPMPTNLHVSRCSVGVASAELVLMLQCLEW